MAGYAGRQVVLEWNGAEILGVREKGITLNGEPINVTSDEDDGWRTLLSLVGEQSVDVTVSGVVKSNVLATDWFANTRSRTLLIEWPNGDTMTGTFVMSAYSSAGPYNDAVTFDATFQSNGTVTFTPYS